MFSTQAFVRLAVPCSLLVVAACSSGSSVVVDDDTGQGDSIQQTIATASSLVAGATVSLSPGSLPASTAATTPLAIGNSTAPQGGTTQVQVTSTAAFDQLLVAVADAVGYWTIEFPTAQTTVDSLFTLSAAVPAGGFDCVYVTRDAVSGQFSQPFTADVAVIAVGSGLLQVSLTWDTDADLDLYVTDPLNEQISFFNRTSSSGGELDLDANIGCGTVGAENVFWETTPPSGTYIVAVDNFSQCSQTSSNYVITVTAPGQAPLVVSGSVTPADGVQTATDFTVN